MIDKTVYIVGAGFSAPLGLPLMGNFLEKAKDLFVDYPGDYEYFEDVFHQISRMSTMKNYFDSDLFNIEEILSILEMESFLEGESLSQNFKNFLGDVIRAYTPPISTPREKPLPGNWEDFFFSNDKKYRKYGIFTGSLFNVEVQKSDKEPKWDAKKATSRKSDYSIITLNYDDVFEQCASFIRQECTKAYFLEFKTHSSDFSEEGTPVIAKLHGSVDNDVIIPPTWAKGIDPTISATWKHAFGLLSQANNIRFLGYSLPVSDAYVKYLLKSSILNADHLKSIDAIVMDPDGSVEKRYNELISFKKFRFRNADISNYLSNIEFNLDSTVKKGKSTGKQHRKIEATQLEDAHEEFMATDLY